MSTNDPTNEGMQHLAKAHYHLGRLSVYLEHAHKNAEEGQELINNLCKNMCLSTNTGDSYETTQEEDSTN